MDFITVTALNKYVKTVLDRDSVINPIWVAGEVSSFVKNRASGHCYFIIKDENAAVKAVMFRSSADKLKFDIENGMSVIVNANVTIYERDGSFQLNVYDIVLRGVGERQQELQKLKQKFEAEGLFAAARKKPLPRFPKRIAVVTSESGAALHDIINVISRRWRDVTLMLVPVPVQGDASEAPIARAVGKIDSLGCDLAIVARGGGSAEDLFVFNAESIVRAAARCSTPIISAVGHETDFTLLDFVSDFRAPTPSAAAEIAVPDFRDFEKAAYSVLLTCRSGLERKYLKISNRFDMIKSAEQLSNPLSAIEARQANPLRLFADIGVMLKRKMQGCRARLELNSERISAQNPIEVLRRGYTAVVQDGRHIVRKSAFDASRAFTIRFYDGEVEFNKEKK